MFPLSLLTEPVNCTSCISVQNKMRLFCASTWNYQLLFCIVFQAGVHNHQPFTEFATTKAILA
uniref:Uncharacterized protein n=1 Tax=Arion vulgaris TaxID=1028688 RepID=A0A0B6ZAQ7_9EUPU